MRNNRRIRIILAALTVLVCGMLAVSACAGTSTERSGGAGGSSYWTQQLNSLAPFKFDKHLYGLGYGNCPVYSAPSEYAYRAANGKASCQTSNYQVDEAGYVDGWLLVRYEINKGSWRVGYIPPKYVRGFKSSMSAHFGWIPATANGTIYVTDNPYSHSGSFAVLSRGEKFHVLSQYTYYEKDGYDWWYIECDVDGLVARDFIEKYADFSVD